VTKIAILAAAAVALLPAAASAQTFGAETQTVLVPYSDINLASDTGQDRLQRRIGTAVDQVCGKRERELNRDAAVKRCRGAAFADAKSQVDALGTEPRRGTVTVTAMR